MNSKDSNITDGLLPQANTESSVNMDAIVSAMSSDADIKDVYYEALFPAARPSDLWFAVYDHLELLQCLMTQQVMCTIDQKTKIPVMNVIPLCNEALYTTFISDQHPELIEGKKLWRIIFRPIDTPQRHVVINSKKGEGMISIDPKFDGLGIRLITKPVPIENWYGVDRFVDGQWLRTNVLSNLTLLHKMGYDIHYNHIVEELNGKLANKDSDINSLRNQFDLAEQEHKAEIERHQKHLSQSQSDKDLTLAHNVALMRDMDRWADDEWYEKEMLGLQQIIAELMKQLEAEQLNNLITDEKTKADLHEGENNKEYAKYLESLLRNKGISFTPRKAA